MSATLGFDTATADTVVGTLSDGEAGETLIGPAPDGRPSHGRSLLPAIEAAVTAVGGWPAIGLIAVGVGPGSFTGLRIGISTARALAQARRLPLAPVPTTTVLVAGIAQLEEAADRPRLAVIDARRGEVFVALDRGDGAGEPLVVDPSRLAEQLAPDELSGALAAGDGSLRFRSEIEAAGVEVLPDSSPAHRPSAERICLLGAARATVAVERLVPLYLRRPDAERWHGRDRRN